MITTRQDFHIGVPPCGSVVSLACPDTTVCLVYRGPVQMGTAEREIGANETEKAADKAFKKVVPSKKKTS